ncbi:hypothetical protein MCOR27_005532 [Pyricularia oryzae]|uniref:Uncharacterized protein n=5 Tax=Pyricularia TaxID=48558 RepID=A0ABQ8NLS1_PYRGI|nr:uncharacterized protein MGG_04539 [Pyricularia oryzae 70-15]XP_030983907.1 uncharacterized protein PgNI_04835 [Pyricularia grisea]ELQ37056.1 hypothetical protein OOU_Y34scaffold00619g29 [Pyricularia oryzae Y34]KAH8837482.1 hypothetical protein MCOR01_011101 [Pyricularia oryzae]TLD23038.1 hypothetical protein PspLS_07502 [Pyricularia sp. CBS 133598]EHA53784.1 hypothetical protein MGG_04539 [Pyricularia oryzae 70-15]KAH9437838.1 hypothetical protein MCOR02_001483 [Pyricularia oryzae]
MVHLLNSYVDKRVVIMTTDGRMLIGTLINSDNQANIILYNVTERHIAPADGDEDSVDRPSVGTEIIRGSTILVVGLVDEELEGSIDWTKVRGEPIGDTYNA